MDESDKDFYLNFYSRKDYCPSGHVASHDSIPGGHIMSLIASTTYIYVDPCKLPKHITEIPLQGGEKPMKFHAGVFSSKRDGEGFLTP